ncbi:MAG: CAP domain-containing protein [Deinococcales bacterium]
MLRSWSLLGVLLLAGSLLLAGCGTVAPPPQAATLLGLVNQARSSARSCGTTPYGAAPPLALDGRLTRAAQLHSQDMETNDFFSHTGSNGSSLGQRLEAQGYAYSWAGEDIAYGFTSPETVMAAWLKSPGHCANIMNSHFTDLGTGVAGTYWTLDFGTPR